MNKLLSLLSLFALISGFSEKVFANEKVIYFGKNEVMNGALKGNTIEPLHQGENVILQFFMTEVAAFVSGPYCLPSVPHLFVRFTDGAFSEIKNLPRAYYQARGPYMVWESDVANINLEIPKNADRIEVYALYDRISYSGYSCYLAYDMMECPDSFPINPDYVSNYGKNFNIPVLP